MAGFNAPGGFNSAISTKVVAPTVFSSYTTYSGSTSGLTNCLANLDYLHLADNVIGDQYNQKNPNADIRVAKWPNLGIGGSKYDWVQGVRSQAYTYLTNQINGLPALQSNGFDAYMRFGPAGMDLLNNLNGLVLFCLFKPNAAVQVSVTSVSGNGTSAVYTCSGVLDTSTIYKSRLVTITGTSNAGFNVTRQTITAVSGNTFTIANATNATATGGTASFWAGDGGLLYVNCGTGTNMRLYNFHLGNGTNGQGTIDWNLRRSDTDTAVNEFNSTGVSYYPLGSWCFGMFTIDYTTNTNNLKYYNLVGGTGSGVNNTSITTPVLTQSVFTGAATTTDATNSSISRTASSYFDTYGNGGIVLGKLGGTYADTLKQSFDGLFACDGALRLTGANTLSNSTNVIRACAAELKARFAL